MNKKNRMYALILLTLVVIFVLTRLNERTEVRTSFFALSLNELSAFEIANDTDTLRIAQKNDSWIIEYPFHLPVQQKRIDDFIEKVLPVEYSHTPLSESESSHDDFNVSDSLGTRLKIWNQNGNVVSETIIGRSNNFHYANVRHKDDKNVYQLQSNITYNLNPSLSLWRDRTILALQNDAVQSVSVAYDNHHYSLTVADTAWVYESGNETMEVNPEQTSLRDIITSLQAYQASDFVDFEFETYKNDFASPVLEVMIQTFDNETFHLAYIEEENNRYLIQKNGETDHLFIVFQNLAEKFMVSKSDFE